MRSLLEVLEELVSFTDYISVRLTEEELITIEKLEDEIYKHALKDS